jgi:predicted MPP superfamily phosphohydrolase
VLDEWTLQSLRERVGDDYLALRLNAQVDRTLRIKGRGRSRFHIENIPQVYTALRHVLRITGLNRVGERNALALQVRERTVPVKGLPPEFDGLRILQLTDLHLDVHPGLAANAARTIQGARFDLCVLTGDYRRGVKGPYAQIEADMQVLVPALVCRYGVYGILGNHDFIEMAPMLQRTGVRMLLNEAVRLSAGEASVWLVGLDDPHFYGLHDFERALADVPPHALRMLLVHSPEVIPEASRCGFFLYLTGHTHAGQICLPGGRPITVNARCSRRYAARAWRYNGMAGYTSAGVGASGVFARFFCPPEAVIHELRRAS